MLETRTDWLGVGRDQAKGVCSRLVLASAWRIDNCGLWFSYQDGKRHIKRDLQQLKKAAVPICKQTDSAELTRLRRAARMLPGNRDAEEGEELLLHGLNPANLLAMLRNGFNERFAGSNAGTAFAQGTYFAEDVGKVDHYTKVDRGKALLPGWLWASDAAKLHRLHMRLYSSSYRTKAMSSMCSSRTSLWDTQCGPRRCSTSMLCPCTTWVSGSSDSATVS